MPKNLAQYQLLISCPGDIITEIPIIKKVVEEFNEKFSDTLGVSIISKHWSTSSYPQSGGTAQSLLNQQFIQECDLAVGVMWTRFGTPTDEYGSGTEEEINIMLNADKQVFMYFSDKPLSPSESQKNSEEYKKVFQFQKDYETKHRGIYARYSSDIEFSQYFSAHLAQHFTKLIKVNNISDNKDTNDEMAYIILEEMKESTFFPILQKDRIKMTIKKNLLRLDNVDVLSFVKLAIRTLQKTENKIQCDNIIKFIAELNCFVGEDYEDYIIELINKDIYELFLLKVISMNVNILDGLSEDSIDKIILKLRINLQKKSLKNSEEWLIIVLSNKLQKGDFTIKVVKALCHYSPNIKFDFLYNILESQQCSDIMRDNINLLIADINFQLCHYQDYYLLKIIVNLNNPSMYQHWIDLITKSIDTYGYETANTAVCTFNKFINSDWASKISEDSVILFVETIVRVGRKTENRPYSVSDTLGELRTKCPKLIEIFVNAVFINADDLQKNINFYLDGNYIADVLSYILSCESIAERIISNVMRYSSDKNISYLKSIIENWIGIITDENSRKRILELFD